ncbi:carbohydrate ABC transporter membrane protein 2 (CUT1 family) [Rhizobium sp. PP-F2F-G38]|uniref:Carbohydrate ABC transporter permease n=1 Tax=Ferranicluibacter rubi TaxID=2715133 RepID=A0AA44CAC5_9HYPH|nr:carbohydrate ABC transporter permease [Ferranicluibacter rubi]NHT75724.1 carbohydrate ABC transporter permease [Ferranicluibacter rubi]PYE32598.1 carbohydrate ABC transporter membrane protein 2 (CUT1 family) [Rhizobium sp. PP-WC-1G-195]PYE96027.1 carbohydrate ABC transporter membrane protein 2 (CUT1 family) [Rhizobium sp. PP-F2F-G38]TCP88368.1 carbohydrate ABC transporter membrane protein 2 (CUT1 family) [Rhizobium sp. PP-CC-2G-626]
MTSRYRLVSIGLHLVMSVWTLFVLAPLCLMFVAAFKSQADIFTRPLGLPRTLSFAAFERAWGIGIGGFLFNSVVVTALSVTLIVVVSALAAYVLARASSRRMQALYLLIVAGFAVPVQSVLVPLYQLVSAAGLLNSQIAIVIPYAAYGIPFTTMLFYAFFLEFPRELEEAARLDGCSRFQVFWRIVLPLSGPVVASAAIFQAVFNWNEFILALMLLTETRVRTLPVGIYGLIGQYSADWPALMAGLAIATVPLLIVFVAAQRHFVRSMSGLGK